MCRALGRGKRSLARVLSLPCGFHNRWIGIKGTRRQYNVVAGRENLRDERLVNKRALRATLLNKRIAIRTEDHQGVDTRLHPLGHRQHDTPVMRGSFTSTCVKISSSVPT